MATKSTPRAGRSSKSVQPRGERGAASGFSDDASKIALTLGKSLKQLRIARGLSQEELAEDADVDRTFISRIERGTANPTLFVMSNLCAALDILLADLVAPIKANLRPVGMDERRQQRQPVRRPLR